jgi:hypothetical protein
MDLFFFFLLLLICSFTSLSFVSAAHNWLLCWCSYNKDFFWTPKCSMLNIWHMIYCTIMPFLDLCGNGYIGWHVWHNGDIGTCWYASADIHIFSLFVQFYVQQCFRILFADYMFESFMIVESLACVTFICWKASVTDPRENGCNCNPWCTVIHYFKALVWQFTCQKNVDTLDSMSVTWCIILSYFN